MNLFHNLAICILLCCLAQFCWTNSFDGDTKKIRHKRDAFSSLIKKKGIKAAAAAAVAAASISKKKFFPLPIPFPLPILKPPIIETIPVPIGLGHIGGFGGFGGGFGHGGFGK